MNLNQLIGIGLRHPHYAKIIDELPSIGWFEIHSENFFQDGITIETLLTIRNNYPISLHGIGLSLGSASGVLEKHLVKLKKLINLVNPFLVSEHLSWGYINGIYMPDLLPIPYTQESLKIFTNNINITQNFLERNILIENPSSYLEYKASEMEEIDFLVALCKATGAYILLDVNNIYVSCFNHGWDAYKYIDKIPKDLVKEIHLAGHSSKNLDKNNIIHIDTHDNKVCSEVWKLYEYTINIFGLIPTLLEWDANIPELSILREESLKALPILEKFKLGIECKN